MIYMHRVKYLTKYENHEREENVLFYSKEKEIDLNSDFLKKVVFVAGSVRDHFQYGYKLKEIVSTEFIREMVYLFGSVTLSDGTIINIPETKPMVKDSEVYYLENVLKIKKPIIVSFDLKVSVDKILFISPRGEFKSLTHEEMTLLSSLEEELYNNQFESKAVVKDLL